MLFMVTNRIGEDGNYGDEERPDREFVYLHDYNNEKRGNDKFLKTGKDSFEIALMAELKRLQKVENITPKVGIYLHGFNNNYQDSIDELFDLENSLHAVLNYRPVIIGFSWPSSGNVVAYMADREEARDSVGAFTRFLLDINTLVVKNEQKCFSTTFCVAHSMGNYVLRKGMEYLSDHLGTPAGRKLFDETIMVAPDLSSKDIERDGKGRYIMDFSRRTHIYYSKHDRALKASSAKRFGGNRLGRHGADDYDNLPGNVVLIDAKKFANSEATSGLKDREKNQVSVHSSHRYHKSILEDIVQVMSSIDRDQITSREAYRANGEPMSNHFKLL